ncbi:hypothetical protein Ddye_000697 [Dipteronia dyeriana]|uniref:Ubiquitin-like protease family profile domain-containing protein n=1 Tax=Dipteronia dyeriana TaxID=168575 RepID=A0AAD9XNJ4_9ROSI|nr:hypothetical protein Ddye_000697 [Dipteronia dyeriana]
MSFYTCKTALAVISTDNMQLSDYVTAGVADIPAPPLRRLRAGTIGGGVDHAVPPSIVQEGPSRVRAHQFELVMHSFQELREEFMDIESRLHDRLEIVLDELRDNDRRKEEQHAEMIRTVRTYRHNDDQHHTPLAGSLSMPQHARSDPPCMDYDHPLDSPHLKAYLKIVRKRQRMFPEVYQQNVNIIDPYIYDKLMSAGTRDKPFLEWPVLSYKWIDEQLAWARGNNEDGCRPWKEVDTLFIPVNARGGHWLMARVELTLRSIRLYDPWQHEVQYEIQNE